MQVRKRSRNIGVRCAVAAIVLGLAVCGVLPASAEDTTATGNRVFFRGGFAALNSGRGGELFTDVHSGLGAGPTNSGSTGYYVGAGTDLMLTRDLWGMLKEVAVAGEIGVEFKRWNSNTVVNSEALVGNVTPANVQMTMLTVNVAPKVKFMQGSDFQPWVIPVGLDFHVISPPSNQGGYLDIGVQFGTGAEYRIWKQLWLGVDGRYHLASNQTNSANNYGTVGSYIAIGF